MAISEPISTSNRSMVRISRTRGMRSSTTVSAVSSAAARAGRAEFLEPFVEIVPLSAAPPSMTNLSIGFGLFPARYRIANVITRCRQHTTRLLVRHSRRLGDDSLRPVPQLRILRLHVHHQIAPHISHADERSRREHV